MNGGSRNSGALAKRILDYWFDGELAMGRAVDGKFMKLWFGADPAVDAEIRARFLDDYEHVVANEDGIRDALAGDSHSALAGVILLDQFGRNMFRDTSRMFEGDPLALSFTRGAIKAGLDAQIAHPSMRIFFYLPFIHAENLSMQDEGMQHYRRIYESEPTDSPHKDLLEQNLDYAKRHRDIIAKFERFPHRNAILGRPSTAEETAFLEGGGDTFDARKTKPAGTEAKAP